MVIPEWVGTEKQVLTRLYLVCGSKEKLAACIEEYQKKVKVFDENGENLVLMGFDEQQALK